MTLKDAFLRKIFKRYFRWRLQDLMKPEYVVELEYPIAPNPRYGFGKPSHRRLYEYFDQYRVGYAELLGKLCHYSGSLGAIPFAGEEHSTEPRWNNTYFSDLDAIALYGMLAERNPKRYLEVGSGNSTKFARRAIKDHGLRTRIISIDPNPRGEIDRICDEVIRLPFEDTDMSMYTDLGSEDVLFIDNSHRAFTNSDVTAFFLDVFPALQPGLVLHLHDILLPFDYPPEWSERHYSEQYLLACFLLGMASDRRPRVLLANSFISQDAALNRLAAKIGESEGLERFFEKTHSWRRWIPSYRGVSMWMQMR